MANRENIRGVFFKHINHIKSKLRRLPLRRLFVAAFCVGGLLFVIITPPGQNPDEPAHMFRIWQLSTLNIRADKSVNEDGKVHYGGPVSNSLGQIFTDAHLYDRPDANYRWSSISYSSTSLAPINVNDTQYIPFNNTAVYSPVAYLPGVLAIWIGLLFQLPSIVVFYLVRLAFLASAAILIYLAIKLVPKWKWMFGAVALLPSTLSIAGSVSADPVVIGSTFVFIAYTLRLALQNKAVSIKQFAILGALLAVVSLTKVSYSPVALLLLAIPLFNHHVRNRKSILYLGIATGAAALLAACWLYLVRDIPILPLRDSSINKAFILHHPFAFLQVLFNSIFYSGPIDLTGVIGHFSWLSLPMSDIFVFVGLAAIVLSAFVGPSKDAALFNDNKTARRWIILLVAIIAATYAVMSLSLYIYWSDYYSAVVTGLQARYLIPVLPLILMLLLPLGVSPNQKRLKLAIVTLLAVTYIIGLATAFAGYYIPALTPMA